MGSPVSIQFYRFATGFEKPKCLKFTKTMFEHVSPVGPNLDSTLI